MNPSYLIEHVDRLGPTWRSIAASVVAGDLPTVILISVVTVGLAAWAPGRVRRFAALAIGLYTASLVLVYWISPYEIEWHLVTSVDRVLLGLGMIGVSSILILSAPSETSEPPSPPGSGATVRATERAGPIACPTR